MIQVPSNSGNMETVLKQLQQGMDLGARLLLQLAAIKNDLRDEIGRSRLALRRSLLRRQAKARAVRFPEGEFTLNDLSHVNPLLELSFVRFALCDAIEEGKIEFIQRQETLYPKLTFMIYRKRDCARRKS